MNAIRPTLARLLLPLIAGSAWLAPTPGAQAADSVAAKPALLATPKAEAASAPTSATKKAPNKTRPVSTRALGGDDDLKDLEVERVRGKNR